MSIERLKPHRGRGPGTPNQIGRDQSETCKISIQRKGAGVTHSHSVQKPPATGHLVPVTLPALTRPFERFGSDSRKPVGINNDALDHFNLNSELELLNQIAQ